MTTYGGGMFAGITSALTNTYSVLANASSGKVTLSSIASAQSNSQYAAYINPTFASYIQTNFSSLDTDKDGVLSAAELSNATNKMLSNGLTASQLTQLGSASGLSGETLEQILTHFSEIDANGDGKVTSSEIEGFKLKSAMQEKKTEFANKAAKNMSVFYGDENASSDTDSSSMVSFKNWKTSGSSSTNSSS